MSTVESPDQQPSVGELARRASEHVSTLVRAEIELAKAELSGTVKRAGVGGGMLAAAVGILLFSIPFRFVMIAEVLVAIGLPRWLSYLIVWLFLVVVALVAALVGRSYMKKIEKPERTIESLKDLPEVLHREEPGARRRDVPTVSNGRVELRGNSSYKV